ncbi:MAG: EF-hand domain-containing protein [Yoonia sp.]
MKSTVLIAAIAAGLVLTGLDASAAGRGHDRQTFDFATLDTDQSGTLTVAEIEAAGAARFAAMDTDGNGGLSAAELAAEGAKEKRIAKMIERMDENEDGELQADELRQRVPDAERMISRFDTDEDGEISKEEFDAAAEKRGGRRGGKDDKGQRD